MWAGGMTLVQLVWEELQLQSLKNLTDTHLPCDFRQIPYLTVANRNTLW